MKSEISISARGFEVDISILNKCFLGNVSMEGCAGSNYRNKAGKVLTKSFVRNSIISNSDEDVTCLVKQLINKWGGVSNIINTRQEHKIEKIHLEINIITNSELNSVFFDKDFSQEIFSFCDSIGISFS